MDDSLTARLIFVGIAFLLALLQALGLYILQGIKAETRDIRTDLKEGGKRFLSHETSMAQLDRRVSVIERVCDINHKSALARATDPADFDPAAVRCHEGERQG